MLSSLIVLGTYMYEKFAELTLAEVTENVGIFRELIEVISSFKLSNRIIDFTSLHRSSLYVRDVHWDLFLAARRIG